VVNLRVGVRDLFEMELEGAWRLKVNRNGRISREASIKDAISNLDL